jgi:hypothetical protein
MGLTDLPGTVPANDDPNNNQTYRVMRVVVITLAVLIFLAFSILIAGFVIRLSGGAKSAAAEPAQITQLPAGARIEELKLEGGRVVLRVRTAKGEEIDIVDGGSGRVVGRIIAPSK